MNIGQNSFRASAYHPDLGNEVVEGTITLDPWTLHFEAQNHTLDFPNQTLTIDFDHFESGALRFRHAAHPGWFIQTGDLTILEHRIFRQRFEIRQQVERALRSKGYNWTKLIKPTVAVLAGFVVLAFVLVWMSGLVVQFLLKQVPLSYDRQLGDTALKETLAYEKVVHDPGKVAYLEKIAHRIAPANSNTNVVYRFYIVENLMPNAFAFPGGAVVVNSGMLDFVQSPEELAGVLAHEIAHVTERHGVRKMITTAGPYVALRLFLQNENRFFAALGAGSSLLLTQNFSQKSETAADDAGWKLLLNGKIDPRGLTINLKRLLTESGTFEEARLSAFSSHPPTTERIRRLEKKWNDLQNKEQFVPLEKLPFEQDTEEVKSFRKALHNFNKLQQPGKK